MRAILRVGAVASATLVAGSTACSSSTMEVGSLPGEGSERPAEVKQALSSQPAGPPSWRVLTPSDSGGARLAGYRHEIGKSLCALSSVLETETTPDGSRTRRVGREGVFVELSNGFGGFTLLPPYDLQLSTPFPSGGADHKSRVKSYFVGAGIKPDQIGRIDVAAFMSESGLTNDLDVKSRKSLGHMAILRRAVDGVPVAESYAWARFNGYDRVVSEQVWWPELPAAVSSEATELVKRVADPVAFDVFRAKLPVEAKGLGGTVAIHHSGPIGQKWYAVATWDVIIDKSPRSFGIDGSEKRLVAWTDDFVPSSSVSGTK